MKSEVASSNTQARELGQGITQLGEGLEACSNPGPDSRYTCMCSQKCVAVPHIPTNSLYIHVHNSILSEQLDSCTDTQYVTPPPQPVEVQTLLDSLPALFEACFSCMAYLHCKASVYRGARVGFHKEVSSIPISAVNGAKSVQE